MAGAGRRLPRAFHQFELDLGHPVPDVDHPRPTKWRDVFRRTHQPPRHAWALLGADHHLDRPQPFAVLVRVGRLVRAKSVPQNMRQLFELAG